MRPSRRPTRMVRRQYKGFRTSPSAGDLNSVMGFMFVARVFRPVFRGMGRGMNKQDLITQVADRAGLNRNDAARAVETMLESITDALKRGDEVRLVGFGNFSVTRRKASVGRNPRTGEPLQIKSSAQPKFRPGKVLKEAVQ